MSANDHLKREVERQAKRMRKAERERPTLLSQTVYIGTLGLLVAIPIVGGTYLGSWLDGQAATYSSRWTVGLMVLGVVIGAVNVYLFIRE